MITLKEYKKINNPTRYLGGESGIVMKNSSNIRMCLASPDIYENSMSNQTVITIYNKLNSINNIWCERVFTPMPDYENLIRSNSDLISTLESNTSLNKMNIILFVLDDVLQITNLLNLLNMAKIPMLKERRDETYPIICITGKAVLNPVPFKGFADIFFIGETESILDDFIVTYSEFKNLSKKEIIQNLANIKGIYLGDDTSVEYSIQSELEYTPYNVCIVPSMLNNITLNSTKVSRGCDMPLNICQDKIIYKKVEEKTNSIFEIKDKLRKTGEKDILIDCAHMWNLDNVRDIIYELKVDETFKRSNINLLNVKFNKNNLWALEYIKEEDIPNIIVTGVVKNTSRVVGNCMGKKEILDVATKIFKAGFSNIKLIYIFGTPKENYEDLNAILDVAKDVVNIYNEMCPNTTKTKIVEIELIPFLAFPHTSNELCKISLPESLELKIRYMMDKNIGEKIAIHAHNPYMSCIKQLILRGDDVVGKIIYDAWKNGARLDNNEDMFCKEPWQLAIQKNKKNVKEYLDEIAENTILPWKNIKL